MRICPPGPEAEEVLCELTAHLRAGPDGAGCLDAGAGAKAERIAQIYRAAPPARTARCKPMIHSCSTRACERREVLVRLHDAEALAALQKIHRTRGEWKELEQVLRRRLSPPIRRCPRVSG